MPSVRQTASNIAAHETLFRLGAVSDLVTSAGVVGLALALYVVLNPIGRNLALMASFFRIVETSVFAIITLTDFVALHMLSDADYLLDQPVDSYRVDRLLEPGDLLETGAVSLRLVPSAGHSLGQVGRLLQDRSRRQQEVGDMDSLRRGIPHSGEAGPGGATVVDLFSPVRSDWNEAPRLAVGEGRWP